MNPYPSTKTSSKSWKTKWSSSKTLARKKSIDKK